VLDIASGLEHMHAARIQHRDLKPDNVLFAADGRAVIIDLGLAIVNVAKSTASTAVGAMIYRSPEKAQGQRYGPPDDQWGLGLIAASLALCLSLERWLEAQGSGGGGLFALYRPGVDKFVAAAVEACASLGALASALLAQEASCRPTAAAVVQALSGAGGAWPPIGLAAVSAIEEEVTQRTHSLSGGSDF